MRARWNLNEMSWHTGSNLTFTNCSILNNESQFHAGGVMSIYATTYILNSTISGNR